jgi:amidase
MTDAGFLKATALEQSAAIRSGEISPLELTQMYLNRIHRLNPQLGAFFHVATERAIATAKAQTQQLTQQDRATLPPLFGLPTAIKDLNPVAGMPCSYGVAMLQSHMATADDAMAIVMTQGGCNILGKTATAELGSFPYTEPAGWSPTRNPWNLDYTAGGSSGGAAAAVAAYLLPCAPGSDGGGSLRGPAHCCGLVGMKPSRGRISDAPWGDRLSGLASNGPIARNVADMAALLDVMAQPLPGDWYLLPRPQTSFLAAVTRPLGKLRIGICPSLLPEISLAPAYAETLMTVVDLCVRMGHEVMEVAIDATDLVDPFLTVWQTAIAASSLPAPALSGFNQWLMGRSGSAGDYLQALNRLQALTRRVVSRWQEFDVLLTPVYSHSTILVGAWAELEPPELLEAMRRWIMPAPVFNATGQPALVLPAAVEAGTNLPIGVQLVGRLGAEELLISLAATLEEALAFPAPKGALFGSGSA